MRFNHRLSLVLIVCLSAVSTLQGEETYITKVKVELSTQEVTLEWTGPKADTMPKGPYHSSPGKGKEGIDCNDVAKSKTKGTECTPIGTFKVLAKEPSFMKYPDAKWVVRFQSIERGIALHYWPTVPEFPASHGCVRLAKKDAAKLIYDNSKVDVTVVEVSGTLKPRPKTGE